MPLDTGVFHFVGIGGIGMSAIAEVMHTRGYRVQGSDLKEGAGRSASLARAVLMPIAATGDRRKPLG